MGVDASLFLKNSKKRYYFDRLYNIHTFNDLQDEQLRDRAGDLCDRLYEGLNQSEMLEFLGLCVRGIPFAMREDKSECERRGHAYEEWRHLGNWGWISNLIEVTLKASSDEIFFVRTDTTDDYFDLTDEYEEIPEIRD